MIYWLFLPFIVFGIVELALLIQLGQWIGTGPTVALVMVSALLGIVLARSQGLAVFSRVQRALYEGRVPEEGPIDGLFILIGGVLLVAPGILSDVIGLFLVLPFTRAALKKWLRARLERWISTGTVRLYLR